MSISAGPIQGRAWILDLFLYVFFDKFFSLPVIRSNMAKTFSEQI